MKTQRGFMLMTAMLLSLLIPGITPLAEGNSGGSIPGSPLAATEGERTVRLTVTVKNEKGEFVPGAHVNLYRVGWIVPNVLLDTFPADDQQETDSKGIATFTIKVKEGDKLKVLIEVSREDLQTEKRTVDLGSDSSIVEYSEHFKLNLRPKEGGITGATTTFRLHVVRKGNDEEPVAGAKVVVWLATWPVRKSFSAQTDRNGDAVIVTPLFNDFEITASKEMFGRVSQVMQSKDYPKEVGPITLKLEKQSGAVVTINVIDQDTKLPVGDADVILDSNNSAGYYTGTTDGAGNATLAIPETGSFAVRISQDYYESFAGEARLRPGEDEKTFPFFLKAKEKKGEGSSSIEVTVLQGDKVQRITGYNLPLPDASVTVRWATSSTTSATDGSGRTIFSRDFEGNVEVVVEAARYKRQSRTVRVTEGGRLTKGTASITFLMQPEFSDDTIEVSVLTAGRNNEESAPLAGVTVTAGGKTATTNASGRVKLTGEFPDAVEVAVEKDGYVRQAKSINASGGIGSATFTLLPESDGDSVSIEVSVFTVAKNNETSAPLAGATVTAGGETATTDANGQAKVTGDFADAVEVAVEKSGYLRQAKSINASGGKGSATFTLQIEPDEDSVSITVMTQDAKSGSSSPIVGALVSANGLTATTDSGGKATITGDFKNGVEVEAKAKDFVSQVQQVSIATPARTGSVVFLLQPITSLHLIVEVLDSAKPNNKLEEASVYVLPLGKRLGSSQPLAMNKTNSQGEAVIEIKGGADQLSQIRSGLTLQVGKEKYLAKLSDIAADKLAPSSEALRWTVFLERDWTELRQAIDALEPRVMAWNNDIAAADQAVALVRKMAEEAPKTKERSAALLKEIEAAGMFALGATGITPATLYCMAATRLRSNIQGYKAEADAREQALRTALDNASALAATCSTAKDAESVRAFHRNAIQIAAAIGVIEKKALNDNNELRNLAGHKKDVAKIIEEVEKKVAELRQEAAKAEQAASAAGSNFLRAQNLSNSLSGRHAALQGEVVTLKAKYGLDNFIEGLPPELDKRVVTMVQLLGKQNSNAFTGPDMNWLATVQEAATQVQNDKVSAEALLARYKSVTGASCDDAAMDNIVQEIGALTTGAAIELAAAGDLASKANECTRRGSCAPVVGEVRALLQQGSVQAAEAKISEARAQGCDVSGVNEELDYYKTLNEAVALLKTGHSSCQFQASLDLAQQFPAGVLDKGPIRQAIADLRAGLEAQMATRALLELARQSGVAQNISEQDRFLADAKNRAANYPCLMREVNSFDRSQVKGALTVEEIPDDTTVKDPAKSGKTEGGGFWDSTKEKAGTGHKPPPIVEEIPEDDSTNVATNRTGRKPAVVEEIPEEAVVTEKPRVEEIPDTPASDRTGSNRGTNNSSSTNKGGENKLPPGLKRDKNGNLLPKDGYEWVNPNDPNDHRVKKKPRDPNKPDFWERLGTAAGQTIRDNIGGGAGNTGGTTNPGSGAGGGGGQGVDLSGTWIVTNRYWSKEHTERGFHFPESIKVDTERWEITALGDNRWKVRSTVVSVESVVGSKVVGTTNEGTFSAVDDGGGRLRFILPNGQQQLYTYSQNQFSSTETSAGYFESTFTAKRQ